MSSDSTSQISTDALEPRVYSREEHSISRRNIDSDALKILYRLVRSGYRAYLVGGGVRDLLLGIKPKDFDIGTDARPNQIRSLFRNSRVIGRRFRLVHIFFHGNKIIEVATFRALGEEIEPNSDEQDSSERIVRSENVYGNEQTDAFRRDLTINALFYDISTFSVIDYVGGVEDLRNGIVRVIGDPLVRFREDPVRLMRTVRHAARTAFTIEPATRESLILNRELITQSAPMRLYEEIRKDLHSGSSLKILRAFADNHLLEYFLPELLEYKGALLEDGHALAECLAKIDHKIKNEGAEISTTVILSVIALLSGQKDLTLADLGTRFNSHDELEDHLHQCFLALSVPKKERERIMMLLSAWQDLINMDLARVKTSALARKPYLRDLIDLLDVIAWTDEEHTLLKLARSSARAGQSDRSERRDRRGEERQRSARPRGRGRGPNNRMM